METDARIHPIIETEDKKMKTAWIKIWNDWKGGRREVLNIQATLFEKDSVTGFYRCFGYRDYSNGGHSIISHVHESDIVKFN